MIALVEICRVLPSISCVVAAYALANGGSPAWGWFIFAGVILGAAALVR